MAKHKLIELDAQVRDGLSRENAAWADRARELAYFQMHNAKFILPRADESPRDFEARPKVASALTYRVINELGKGLYNPGPFRAIRNSRPADSFYQSVALANGLDALMQRADELSTLHGAFAIQVAPSEVPGKPIALYPWMASEFAAYPADDDPADIWAVLVRSIYPIRRQVRYQLWDAVEVRTYWTKPGDMQALPDGNGREIEFDPAMSGEHNLGGLPFVFCHAKPPVTDFWEGALGPALIRVNYAVDVKQSDLAQAVQNYANPRSYAVNVSAASRFVHIPGDPVHLTPSSTSDAPPDIFFRQPDIDVEGSWSDINNLIDRAMADLDIPLQAKTDNSYPESGQAQLMRRLSLLNRTLARQPAWEGYERELARKVLLSAAALKLGADDDLAEYASAAATLDMEVNFPPPVIPLPSSARDAQDKFLVDNGLKSRLQLIQERRGLTRDQALRALADIVEDQRAEAAIQAGGAIKPLAPISPLAANTEELAASLATA